MKKATIIFLILTIITFICSSCKVQNNGENRTDEISGKLRFTDSLRKFGATYMTMNNPFFVILDSEIRDYVSRKGDKLITLDPELDVQKQINCIGELISQSVDLIFLNPSDYIGIRPGLETAKKAGVPIIVVDAPVFDDKLVAATIVSDNYAAGEMCAKDICNKLGKEAKVNIVLLEHPSARSASDRIDGFRKAISQYPGMEIIGRKSSNGQLELAMSAMEHLVREHEQIDVVMALNDPSAIGAIAALKAANKLDGVLVYGVDGSEDAKRLIKNGEMTATIAQSPEEIGKLAAESAYMVLAGESVPAFTKTKVKIIDKDTID